MKKISIRLSVLFVAIVAVALISAFAMPAPLSTDKYFVAAADYPNSLAVAVNLKMNEGWAPQGGISSWTNPGDNKTYYLQAMVKK